VSSAAIRLNFFHVQIQHHIPEFTPPLLQSSVVQAFGGDFGFGCDCKLLRCPLAYAQMQPPQAMFNCADRLMVLHEGDVLPDTSVVGEIHADHVVVERDGKTRKEYLFGKK